MRTRTKQYKKKSKPGQRTPWVGLTLARMVYFVLGFMLCAVLVTGFYTFTGPGIALCVGCGVVAALGGQRFVDLFEKWLGVGD